MSFLALSLVLAASAVGQAARFPINAETVIREVVFRFDSTRTFSEARLFEQIATQGPTLGDKMRRWLPLLSERERVLVPEEVQRDVVRLRQFYRANGFPDVEVSYAGSRFYPDRNAFRLRLLIHEGEPIRVATIDILQPDGTPFSAESGLEAPLRGVLTLHVGDRFSDIEHSRSQEQLVTWMKNRGRPFAFVRDSVHVDPAAHRADVTYWVEQGPIAYLDSIIVQGNERVARRLIARELDMDPGERFSQRRLTGAQRALFSKNLFRTVLVDVPEQPVDSTVTVRMQVREGRPRLVTYTTGYGRREGWSVQGDWTHRNLFGDTRVFTVGAVAQTGLLAVSPDRVPPRLYRTSVNLRHPRFILPRMSISWQVFAQYRRDPELPESDRFLGINEREGGFDAALTYEFLPRRTLTLQYTWSRALQYSAAGGFTRDRDAFNRGSLALFGIFGRTGSFLRYRHSILVLPGLEFASPGFGSDIDYLKSAVAVKVSRRFSSRSGLSLRSQASRLWPRGDSGDQDDPLVENRFDSERFYLGGSSDLRGWSSGLAGPKVVRPSVVGSDTTFVYEAVGGLAKLAVDLELRLPFPGMGDSWGTALFIGAGQLSEGGLFDGPFRFGTGGGIRYATPVGMVSLDLAWKINPDDADVRRAGSFEAHGLDAPTSWRRRWSLHLGIGQVF
ncbi:MAG: BamA/TamA family outer membrane protein [Bacteroidetes bacterium]|nr:BamA/TamA family outer membrane protein [Bacteroidota bacterium]MDA0873600.1 BamA/TamA family outer membrane protein [Bacteroidota bacterium]